MYFFDMHIINNSPVTGSISMGKFSLSLTETPQLMGERFGTKIALH